MELDLDTLKQIIDKVDRSGLTAFSLESGEFKLHLERQTPPAAVCVTGAAAPAQPAAETPAEPTDPGARPEVCGTVVTSPIVGTFYASASPDKPPYAKVGQQVKKGDVLFIVESMKLMNEVNSELDGTVAEVYARDGQSLEYGQPVLRIV